MIRLRKGLDLPIPGAPAYTTQAVAPSASVGVLANDYPDLRLSVEVQVGAHVRVGQPLLSDARRPEIRIPSPAAGSVNKVRRDGRRLVAVEIEVGDEAYVEFPRMTLDGIRDQGRERVTQYLLDSGDWCALRERPFGRLATPGTAPAGIFVRAMDTNPLAVDPRCVVRERLDDLHFGLRALTELTDGPVYVCSRPGAIDSVSELDGIECVEFEGPHPAGLVGTHIHHLLPVSHTRSVWYVSYQDVLAMGNLFRLGRPDPFRTISIGGPAVADPRIIRTTIGASTESLVSAPPIPAPCRVISGSLLSGRVVAQPTAFLGRYHEQISVLPERLPDREKEHGVPRQRRWLRARDRWTAELNGARHPFFPLDAFDGIVPLSVPIGPLLRALAAGDARSAIALGALELEEEDLALCTYCCPAKIDYGPLLREVLDATAETQL